MKKQKVSESKEKQKTFQGNVFADKKPVARNFYKIKLSDLYALMNNKK